MFDNVVHLSLDLRNNKLETLNPDSLYQNGSMWRKTGTRILKGKVLKKIDNEAKSVLMTNF